MPRPRAQPLQPQPGLATLEERARTLGADLQAGLLAGLEELGASELGTQALADRLGLTTVLASRIRGALTASGPLEFLLDLPGAEPQRDFLEGLAGGGLGEAHVLRLLNLIESLAAIVSQECGDLRAFHGALAQWVPGAVAAQAALQRQAIHRSLRETEGVEVEAVSSSWAVLPDADGRLRFAHLFSALGITRWREAAPYGLQIALPEGPEGEEDLVLGLEGQRPTQLGLEALRLDAACVRRPGPFRMTRSGVSGRYDLAATGLGPAHAVDLRMAQVEVRSGPPRQPDPGATVGPSFVPHYPTGRVLFEFACPRDFRGGSAPRHLALDTSLSGGMGNLGDPSLRPSLRSTLEPVERLGFEGHELSDGQFPQHRELLQRLVRALGGDPREFVVWRLDMRRPVPWVQAFLAWTHPDTPEDCLAPNPEVYL